MAGDSKATVERDALVESINILWARPDLRTLCLGHLHTLVRGDGTSNDANLWPNRYTNLERVPKSWIAGWLCRYSKGALTRELLNKVDTFDKAGVRHLFECALQVTGETSLPRQCLRKDVCSNTFDARAEQVGHRLRKMMPHIAPLTGQIDWTGAGAYQIVFDEACRGQTVRHISGRGADPSRGLRR